MIVWTVFDLLVRLFESGMFVWFIFKTLDIKASAQYRRAVFLISALLIGGLLTLFCDIIVFEGVAGVCCAAITFVTAALFFHGSFMKKLVVSVLPIVILAISEAIGVHLTALLFQRSPAELLANRDVGYVVSTVIVHVLFGLLWYILKCFFNRNDVILTKAEWLLLSITITVSVIVFVLTVAVLLFIQLYHFGFYSAEDGIQLYIAMTMLFLIAMDCTVCFLFVQLSKKHMVMMENTLLRQQYEFGEKSATDIKRQYDNLQKNASRLQERIARYPRLKRKRQTTGDR